MCDRVTSSLLIISLICAPAFTDLRNCTDCFVGNSCDAVAAAMTIQKKGPVVDAQLNNACDPVRQMTCCSELAAATEYFLALSIKYHPNLVLLPRNCGIGEEGFGDRLSGGALVPGLYEIPWVVLISYKTKIGPQFKCGGSLINELYVLTAAHCFDLGEEVLGVRVGKQILDCLGEPSTCESHVQDMAIQEINLHPDYYRQLPIIRNDIALLRLKSPVLSKNAGTVCLPLTSYLRNRATDHLSATVTHWPKASEKGYTISTIRYADVTINTAQYCREQYNIKPGETDEMRHKICCSYPDGVPTCIVSGSPLLVLDQFRDSERYIQYGIASYGSRFCGMRPEVYTDVTKYLQWILYTIKP